MSQEQRRERLERPIERATAITQRTLAWFPVRVWRRFLRRNGFLLAAGVSYQSLFAFFAALYVALAVAGIWFGGSSDAIDRLVDVVNGYLPGMIGDDGIATREEFHELASASTGLLSATGTIALGLLLWTAIGFVTFARRAVCDIFGLPFDDRGYVLLKARDLLAAAAFGAALLVGSALASAASGALDLILTVSGAPADTVFAHLTVRILFVSVGFVINTLAITGLVRFLTGTSLPVRVILPGSLAGGLAVSVLQIGAGLLVSYTPNNPLLATFAVFIGLLVWFRLNGVVLLVAAAWIATAANDRRLALRELTERERMQAEQAALLLAAEVRLRDARAAAADAGWLRGFGARRELRRAEVALDEAQSRADETTGSPSR